MFRPTPSASAKDSGTIKTSAIPALKHAVSNCFFSFGEIPRGTVKTAFMFCPNVLFGKIYRIQIFNICAHKSS